MLDELMKTEQIRISPAVMTIASSHAVVDQYIVINSFVWISSFRPNKSNTQIRSDRLLCKMPNLTGIEDDVQRYQVITQTELDRSIAREKLLEGDLRANRCIVEKKSHLYSNELGSVW